MEVWPSFFRARIHIKDWRGFSGVFALQGPPINDFGK